MKKFLVDLSDIKVNPLSNNLCYKVGDVFIKVENHPFFGEVEIEKKVVKITHNTYHNYEFVFIENNEIQFDYDDMVEQEISRLMDNPNA